MKKKYKRPLLITLALLFLLESWLWEKTGALIAQAVRHLPFEEYREKLVAYLAKLSPLATLGVFIIPVITLLPLKFLALWLLAKGFFLSGITTIIGAKLVGLGVFSFLFALCKDKLLQLRMVHWLYHTCQHWRAKAHALVKPYTRFLTRYLALLRAHMKRGTLVSKLRARMHRTRKPTAE